MKKKKEEDDEYETGNCGQQENAKLITREYCGR